MSRHHAPATEGEMDRLMLIAPTDLPPAPPFCVRCNVPGHWTTAHRWDEDRDAGDEDDAATRPHRWVMLWGAGAMQQEDALRFGYEMDREHERWSPP